MNDSTDRAGVSFWIGLVVGWAVIAIGVGGAIANRADTKPIEIASRFVELALVHDAVVAPLAFVVGALLTRWLPANTRGPVRGALAISVILVVFAVPLVQRLGARQNSSVLPLAYGPNLAVAVGAVWAVAASTVVVRMIRTRT